MDYFLDLPLVGTFFKKLKIKKHLDRGIGILKYSEKELQDYQFKQLKKMMNYAYKNVPLYREKWSEANVSPEDFRKLEDLQKFPVITKEDFRAGYPDKIIPKAFKKKKTHVVGTSGSTGSAMKMLYSRDKAFLEMATSSSYSINSHFGTDLKSNLLIIVTDSEAMETIIFKEFKQAHKIVCNALDSPQTHIDAINSKKPDSLMSYPSVMRNLCIYAQEKGISLHQPKLILLGSECLDSHTRALMGKTFSCDVINCYGSTEGGMMAVECLEHNGMHVLSAKAIIEIVDDNNNILPPGELGTVLVTDFTNKATPVIRYSGMGDLSSYKKEKCTCKMSMYPLLERMEGRKADMVVLPGNNVINPYKLTTVMAKKPGVAKYQIRQEKRDELKILIVKERTEEAKDITFSKGCKVYEKIIKEFRGIIKDDTVSIKVELVDDIPLKEGNRKSQIVYSLFNQ